MEFNNTFDNKLIEKNCNVLTENWSSVGSIIDVIEYFAINFIFAEFTARSLDVLDYRMVKYEATWWTRNNSVSFVESWRVNYRLVPSFLVATSRKVWIMNSQDKSCERKMAIVFFFFLSFVILDWKVRIIKVGQLRTIVL